MKASLHGTWALRERSPEPSLFEPAKKILSAAGWLASPKTQALTVQALALVSASNPPVAAAAMRTRALPEFGKFIPRSPAAPVRPPPSAVNAAPPSTVPCRALPLESVVCVGFETLLKSQYAARPLALGGAAS